MSPKNILPQRDLTVYLLNEGVTRTTAVECRQGLKPVMIQLGGIEGELLIRRGRRQAPRWAAFFEGKVESREFGLVRGVSAIVLLETSGRLFALSFGHGRFILAPDCWEERFGLRG